MDRIKLGLPGMDKDIVHYQIPIMIGDVTIKPGDVVLGDIDGVLVVPRDIAYDVLVRAEQIKEK